MVQWQAAGGRKLKYATSTIIAFHQDHNHRNTTKLETKPSSLHFVSEIEVHNIYQMKSDPSVNKLLLLLQVNFIKYTYIKFKNSLCYVLSILISMD